MIANKTFLTLLGVSALTVHTASAVADVVTNVALELESQTFFMGSSGPSERFDSNAAVSLELDIQSGDGGDTSWQFTPFGHWDSQDANRTHGDIRELYLLHVMDNWEVLVGISKVFWGVAESNHLVDIINQTDYLENLDGEDKLGQPMLRLSRSFDQGALSLFALPGFRERAFLASDNPLSHPFEINDDPLYESGEGRNHVDFAIRYSGYRDIVDYGLSWFQGTSREADFVFGVDGRLRPLYPQIKQFSLDMQITDEAWLWKFEALRRTFDDPTSGTDFSAAVGGFEYSYYGLQNGLYDLGLLAELHYDSRNNPGTVIFQDDLFLGARFGFTDVESTEVLTGTVIDLQDNTQSFRVESSRRIFNSARLSLEAQFFSNVDPRNLSYSLRDSDYVLLSLTWFL